MKHDKPKRFMDPEYREHAPEMAVILWLFGSLILLVLVVICAGFWWLRLTSGG